MLIKIGGATGCQDRDDCSEEFTVEELDDGLSRITVNDRQTKQARGVALSSSSFLG